jgi:hypothetical protein
MRNTFVIIAFSVLMISFAACKKTEVQTPPSILVNVSGTPTYLPGTTVQYEITVKSGTADLKYFSVSGAGSVKPYTGSGIDHTAPADIWNATDKLFIAGTRSATIYYNVVIDPALTTGISYDLNFAVVDYGQNLVYTQKAITIPPVK